MWLWCVVFPQGRIMHGKCTDRLVLSYFTDVCGIDNSMDERHAGLERTTIPLHLNSVTIDSSPSCSIS